MIWYRPVRIQIEVIVAYVKALARNSLREAEEITKTEG
jgi:hypothetical protein